VEDCVTYLDSTLSTAELIACALRGDCTCPGVVPDDYARACHAEGGSYQNFGARLRLNLAAEPSGPVQMEVCNAVWFCFPQVCSEEDIFFLLADMPNLADAAKLPSKFPKLANITDAFLTPDCNTNQHTPGPTSPTPPTPPPTSISPKPDGPTNQRVTKTQVTVVTSVVTTFCITVVLLVIIADYRKRKTPADEEKEQNLRDGNERLLAKNDRHGLLHSSGGATLMSAADPNSSGRSTQSLPVQGTHAMEAGPVRSSSVNGVDDATTAPRLLSDL